MDKTKELIVIAGPTASGKTSLAIELALQYGCEIFSADSRQVYSELNIGVAKPTPDQLSMVPHHLIGHISIHQAYDTGIYENEAINLLDAYFQDHDKAILVGGTGLYIQAVIHGLDSFPPIEEKIKSELKQEYDRDGLEALLWELKDKDVHSYHNLDIQNPRRVLRALEVIRQTGKPFSSFKLGGGKARPFKVDFRFLNPERDLLYHAINNRVDDMMANGLLDEVTALFPFREVQALQTVGYAELFDYLGGTLTLDEAVDKIKQHTRNYAKRQVTWFKKFKP